MKPTTKTKVIRRCPLRDRTNALLRGAGLAVNALAYERHLTKHYHPISVHRYLRGAAVTDAHRAFAVYDTAVALCARAVDCSKGRGHITLRNGEEGMVRAAVMIGKKQVCHADRKTEAQAIEACKKIVAAKFPPAAVEPTPEA
jgi:hypothetical protein